MKALIIGASAGLGRAIAERLAFDGHSLFLVASDARDLEPLSRDLSLRFRVPVSFYAMNLKNFDAQELQQQVHSVFGAIDALFLVAGLSLAYDSGKLLEQEVESVVHVNFLAPVKIVHAFLNDLRRSSDAHCVGIGSVASSRARGSNMVYAASKCGLEFYFDGLRHLLSSSNCRVQFYRVGFLRTQMSFGKSALLPAASPSRVANKIVRRLYHGSSPMYLPGWWRWVMLAWRLIPWFLYKRLQIH